MAFEHSAALYEDSAGLAERVAVRLAERILAGEAAIAVATEEHRHALAASLAAHGLDAAALEAEERLLLVDAEETLAAVLEDGAPSASRFERAIGASLDRAAGPESARDVCAYGELVDLLWQRGEPAAADEVERLWNGLAERRDFSLLCGYRIADPFERDVHAALLPQLCRTHLHVEPSGDAARLEEAVDGALAESLGPGDAARVRALAAAHRRPEQVPAAHAALMWLSAHMPRTAERVFAAARERYGAA